MNPTLDTSAHHEVMVAIDALRQQVLQFEHQFHGALDAIRPEARASARNLLHYLALRQHDLRSLQLELARLGLSSLGRAEAHVLATLNAVRAALQRMEPDLPPAHLEEPPVDFDSGTALLDACTHALLGPKRGGMKSRIMVTMPTDAADDPSIIRELVEAGMSVARINCAHDDVEHWQRMMQHLRAAETEFGVQCNVHFDLGGPKLRTKNPTDDDTYTTGYVHVHPGDAVWLLTDTAQRGGLPGKAISVECTLPDVLVHVKTGERVYFDDGKIAGSVEDAQPGRLLIRASYARAGAAKIQADKGINFPDSVLPIDALTAQDVEHLDFIVHHADSVGLSFARTVSDVAALDQALSARGAVSTGIIIKVETRLGFENLARMLLAAMRSRPVGVMVARGDLGVEIGYERLAEVQEELLWISEAAHVPVIWATEVLDRMAKKGAPSRAEVTDAAMSARAECVMLNKGPHIVTAVRFLRDVLNRMHDHQNKKQSMLRKLSISQLA